MEKIASIEKERDDALAAVQARTDMRLSLLASGEASDELRVSAIKLTAEKRRARAARQEQAEAAARAKIEARYAGRYEEIRQFDESRRASWELSQGLSTSR